VKKSTDYAVGGTGSMIAGLGLVVGALLSAPSGTGTLWLVVAYVPVRIVITSIGAYRLWKAQEFYVDERTRGARHALGPRTGRNSPVRKAGTNRRSISPSPSLRVVGHGEFLRETGREESG